MSNVQKRPTADLAVQRNAIVSALSIETLTLQTTPGGRLETDLRERALLPAAP
jgi:hypothetical protein